MDKQRILIVDDNPDLRRAMKIRLQASHYEVFQAEDGYSAIFVAQHSCPNLIILDLGLPGLDGYVVLERLRDSDALCHIPVIVLTARTPQSNERKALLAGAIAFFQKPHENAQLLDAISAILPATTKATRLPS
jgi:DNA-binding response OmpR family regulator